MLRRFLVPFFFLFTFTGALHAQAGFGAPLPDASVGVPYSFDFGAALTQLIGPIPPDITLTFTFTPSAGSSLPPGLTLQSNGLLSGTPTTNGSFQFSIDIAVHIVVQGQPAFDETVPIPQILTVGGTSGPTVVDPGGLTFAFNQGSTTASSQTITLTNRGSQAKTFTASASTNSSARFSVSPSSGSIGPFASSSVLVTVDPTGLPAGTFVGKASITVSPSGESFDVPVLITVTSSQQSIQLSQTGLRFQTVAGGGAPPPQMISVFNGGAGSLAFSVSASTISGGSWLSVSPVSGSSSSTSSASVTASVNPSGLAAGNYYGQITFTSPGVANSPQIVSVVLNVFTPDASPGALITPTGLIFVGQAGTTPASKNISINNPSPTPIMFTTAVFSTTGPTFFTATPLNGTVRTGTPSTVTVQPVLTGLTAGVYRGELDFVFSDGSIRRVAIILIVTPSSGSSPAGSLATRLTGAPLAAGCTPTKLIPVFTQLGAGFKVTAGWPTPIETTIVDDCGTLMTTGSVVATFSSGDPALALGSLKDGRWTATWQPRNTSSAQVTITVKAQQTQPSLQGSEQIGGGLQANTAVPIISAGGVVSAASIAAQQPLAPGTFISIYGTNLSQGLDSSATLPLSTKLAGAQVILGGKQLPLQFASTGQINAIVGFDVPPNTTQQLIVQQGSTVSVPEPVTIAPAQPAVFTPDASGKGPGIIDVYKSDGTHLGVGQPVSAGYVVVIFCSGLGAVDPPLVAGAAPAQPSKTVNDVTATIGGVNAPVQFAGVVVGFPGLYQVNAVVPSGVTPGDSVPLVLSVAGQQSTPVTIKVQSPM